LSTVGSGNAEKSIRVPDAIMAFVHVLNSRRDNPRSRIAIANADICSGATLPRVNSAITHSICSSSRTRPSRLALMIDTASGMVVHASFVEVVGAECVREQLCQPTRPGGGIDEQIRAAELVQQLPAPPARHEDLASGIATGKGNEPAPAGRVQVRHQPALGAQAQTV
jgi:hypothetical protein